ncbi:hypothetical protein [Spirosoma spitsbergense]|nr:hypothetical protein [Spirosoma spitsbergense]
MDKTTYFRYGAKKKAAECLFPGWECPHSVFKPTDNPDRINVRPND